MRTLENFTHLYPVQKTLRFALDFPVGDSLLNFKKGFDEEKQTFKADQKIEDAYQELKPKLDQVHEWFIENSLTSKSAKAINFEPYWKIYRESVNLRKNDKYQNKSKIETLEVELRNKICRCYKDGGEALKAKYGEEIKWKKNSKNVEGCKMLHCQGVLEFVQKEHLNCEKTQDAINVFKGFYTALEGYNTNRDNYYSNESKATSIAHRIVNENLAKFCSNAFYFSSQEEEFLNAYDELKKAGKRLIDSKGNALEEINRELFSIKKFSNYLSQKGIEEYNKAISNANRVTNLFNQQHANEKKFKNLPKLKELFKQIGCGVRVPLFYKLTHLTEEEAKANKENYLKPYSVEQILKDAQEAGDQFFTQSSKKTEEHSEVIETVGDFIDWLRDKNEQNNWEGIYWSKKAIRNISNQFFANWEDILEKVKSVKSIASNDKKRIEVIQLHDAVELKSLFEHLDRYQLNEDGTINESWTTSFFKPSILKKLKETSEANNTDRPSQILINCIIGDLKNHIDAFHKGSLDEKGNRENNSIGDLVETVEKLKAGKKSKIKDVDKMHIKSCLDHTLAICHSLKYFQVQESKVKGSPIDPDLDYGLQTLLSKNLLKGKENSNWFNWYDALRNYLSKRPLDDATKLKLYFESSTIGKGWSKSKESANLCTILLKDKKYYLGIIDKEHNQIFKNLDTSLITKEIEENKRKKAKKEEEFSKKKKGTKIYNDLNNEIKNLQKTILSEEGKLNSLQDKKNAYKKMVYSFFKDGTTMIPKCSTQLQSVKERFKDYPNLKYVKLIASNKIKDYDMGDEHNIRIGEKSQGVGKFITDFKITREIFELNNLVYDAKTEQFVSKRNSGDKRPKKFQKKYLDLTRDQKGYKQAIQKWIHFCQYFLDNYTEVVEAKYDYEDCFEKNYDRLDKFYSELNSKIYKVTFEDISDKYINKCIEEGKLYLFQIYSKDFSEKSTGKKNLQTYYWQEVIKEKSPLKLDGGAEIFYRKKVIKMNKARKEKGHHYEQQRDHCKSKGKPFFPIIKDKRYTEERFLFHCPITLNYAAQGSPKPKYALPSFNEQLNEGINDNAYFLGIDRGEKHLIYFSLIDNKGKLIDQGSLNIAFYDKDENPRTIEKTKYTWNQKQKKWDENTVQCWDYNDLLDCEASHRDWARKNWQTIGKIRNLKEGYLSQVIHEITKKIINNSDKLIFIVLEDLNSGFKRSRQKIEKQIYQKFETALAKKLNFIVDKDKTRESFLSPIRAVQLTPPVINYQDIGDEKQVGILLYTRANYTSVTDPNTGWRKTVYLKRGKQSDIKDQILKTFDDFGFDGKDYFFEYTNKNTNKKWRLWSGKEGESLPRYRGKRGREKYEWKIEKIDVVKKLNNLFAGFDKGRSLKKQIENEEHELKKITNDSHSKSPWETLSWCIELIQQIRNSNGRKGELSDNFLYSPVRCEKGIHFDSRCASKNLPENADANGAYNIARKGLIMFRHIEKWKNEGKQKYNADNPDLDLFISDEEWDLWLNNKPEWENRVSEFSSRKKMEKLRSRNSVKKTRGKVKKKSQSKE